VSDPCQPIQDEIDGLEAEISSLGEELASTPPPQKPAIAAQIRELETQRRTKAAELRECRNSFPVPRDLTGVWLSNDGGVYAIRQLGDAIWWAGLSAESRGGVDDFQLGLAFSNVLHGRLAGDRITADWADVPRGTILQNGTLSIDVLSNSELNRQAETGGFGASHWTRADLAPPLDIRSRLDRVIRNDGDSMHDHLKMYKDDVVIYGTVTTDLGVNCPVSSPGGASRRYANFMCNADGNFDEDDLDGDINLFNLQVDRVVGANSLGTSLDDQPGFWTDGWFNNPEHIRAKLNASNNHFHSCEVIMYGRAAGKEICFLGGTGEVGPLLPGWMENGANSVLFDGSPINGQVDRFPSGPFPVRIFNQDPPAGTRIRVTGFLALDCHGGDCEEDDAGSNNVEIHPVYAIDLIQPAPQRTEFTGVWGASDVGTYYVRQLGNTVWWLGLSRDRGRTFANVFHGQFTPRGGAGTIQGQWADVPLGITRNNGELSLDCPDFKTINRVSATGGFGARRWEKLYEGGLSVGPVG
jgi:hypothetical protein